MLAPKNAQARLAPLGPVNTMIQLPPPRPGRQVMPMMAPDVLYALCRFDLADGPVRLKARVADDLWMIAFYTPDGDNFYTVAGADLKQAALNLVIATSDQTVAEASVDAPETSEDVVVVNSPVSEGIALIRAPLAGPSRTERAARALELSYCGPYAKSG
jgi:uncharacterized membrane protein